MFISQTSLTYFYKWPSTCGIEILTDVTDLQLMWPEALPSFASQRANGTRVYNTINYNTINIFFSHGKTFSILQNEKYTILQKEKH
jgi:hypothetical protein